MRKRLHDVGPFHWCMVPSGVAVKFLEVGEMGLDLAVRKL